MGQPTLMKGPNNVQKGISYSFCPGKRGSIKCSPRHCEFSDAPIHIHCGDQPNGHKKMANKRIKSF